MYLWTEKDYLFVKIAQEKFRSFKNALKNGLKPTCDRKGRTCAIIADILFTISV